MLRRIELVRETFIAASGQFRPGLRFVIRRVGALALSGPLVAVALLRRSRVASGRDRRARNRSHFFWVVPMSSLLGPGLC